MKFLLQFLLHSSFIERKIFIFSMFLSLAKSKEMSGLVRMCQKFHTTYSTFHLEVQFLTPEMTEFPKAYGGINGTKTVILM